MSTLLKTSPRESLTASLELFESTYWDVASSMLNHNPVLWSWYLNCVTWPTEGGSLHLWEVVSVKIQAKFDGEGQDVWSETPLTEEGTVRLCEPVTWLSARGVTGILMDSLFHGDKGRHCRGRCLEGASKKDTGEKVKFTSTYQSESCLICAKSIFSETWITIVRNSQLLLS